LYFSKHRIDILFPYLISGNKEAIAKLNKRTVSVTPKHNEEAKKLLRLMGVPVIEAPTEAEAQCTAMVKAGLCYAVASEDMDTLTLGAPILLRSTHSLLISTFFT
jgi:flap endonuclease-1